MGAAALFFRELAEFAAIAPMRLDCREGAKNRLTGKIRSVESKL